MQFDLLFTRRRLPELDTKKTMIVVADVLRATTVMVRALEQGANAIFPQEDEESAKAMFTLLQEQGIPVLLCGEQDGKKRDGYDLGNSPREFTKDIVQDKVVIQLTTNGTRTLAQTRQAAKVAIASFSNMKAVANRLRQYQDEVDQLLFVASGKEGRYCLEDTVCLGGVLAHLIEPPGKPFEMTDSVRSALDLYHMYRDRLLPMLQTCDHGAYLTSIGLEDDLPECALMNTSEIVPMMKGNRISLQG